jgi:hypothetical protein
LYQVKNDAGSTGKSILLCDGRKLGLKTGIDGYENTTPELCMVARGGRRGLQEVVGRVFWIVRKSQGRDNLEKVFGGNG